MQKPLVTQSYGKPCLAVERKFAQSLPLSILKLKEFLYLGHISGLRQAVNYYRGSERLLCKKVPLVK